VQLFRMSWRDSMGYACSELLEKCGMQASSEGCSLVYIAVMILVAGEVSTWAVLTMNLLTALVCLLGVKNGVGRCRELASAERQRRATHKGLQGIGAATAPVHDQDLCHACGARLMADSRFCGRCGTRRSHEAGQTLNQDATYCATLIHFQDYHARRVLTQQRLRLMIVAFRICEVLPVAVGLALWCLCGQIATAYAVGMLAAIAWEMIHPRARPTRGSWFFGLIERLFECFLWPIYYTFTPLHLADPTRDHNEEEAVLDHLMLPAWSGLRLLYIVILWIGVCFNSQCWPGFPEFLAWSDLRDPQRWQLVMAWCWFFSGGLAAVVFPILAVRVHYKRELWADEDWKEFVKHQVGAWQTVSDVLSIPALYNFRGWDLQEIEAINPDEDVISFLKGLASDIGDTSEQLHLLAELDPQKKAGLRHLQASASKAPAAAQAPPSKSKASSSAPRKVDPASSSTENSKEVQQVLDLKMPSMYKAKLDAAVVLNVEMSDIFGEDIFTIDTSLEDGTKHGVGELKDGGLVFSIWQDQELNEKVRVRRKLRGQSTFEVCYPAGEVFAELHLTQRHDFLLKHQGRGLFVFWIDSGRFRHQRRIVANPLVTDPKNQAAGPQVKQDICLAEGGKDLFSGQWRFRAFPGVDALMMVSCMLCIAVHHNESDP